MPIAPSTHRPFAERDEPTPEGQGKHQHLYGSYRWKQVRLRFLARHPLCVECQKMGLTTAATVVDHKIRHHGNPKLFWDPNNWQPMCQSHHSSDKQAEEHAATR